MDTNQSISNPSLGAFIYSNLQRKCPDTVAMVDTGTNEEITYQQVQKLSVKLAIAFKNLGIKKFDRIAIVSLNSWKYLLTTIAGFYIGAPIILTSFNHTLRELKYVFSIAKPKYVVCSNNFLEEVLTVQKELGFIHQIISFDDCKLGEVLNWNQLLDSGDDSQDFLPVVINPDEDIALISNSSGTTGLGKCVLKTHSALRKNLQRYVNLSSDDAETLLAFPEFSFEMGLWHGLASILNRNKVIILPKCKTPLLLEAIFKYKISSFVCVPSVLAAMAEDPFMESRDFSFVKDIISGGGPLTETIRKLTKEQFRAATVRQVYGITEMTSIALMPKNEEKANNCVGKLVDPSIEIKVVDVTTGKTVGPNKIGELYIKSPFIMKGYLDNDKATEDAFVNGFFKTGDLGYFDKENYFYLIDRIFDMIFFEGETVSPTEIENLLLEHPAVEETAVIGVSSEQFGEVALAFVVKQQDSSITEEEIVQFVKKHLSKQKQLHGGVRFISNMPRNANRKVLRRQLREMV